MHEYSIVAQLIDMCQSHALQHKASSIAKVRIAIGERSGVDGALIKSAFESFRLESPLCQNAQLEIEYQEVALYCEDCGHNFSAKDRIYSICPLCQSNKVTITQGKELHLLSLELDVQAP